jgi:hypothetical protein
MNMRTQPGRPYRRALNNLLLPLLAITLACTPAHSGTCDDAFKSVVNWLNQGPSYWVTAVVASNRAAALPYMKSEVTYSNIPLAKNAFGWLVTAGNGSQVELFNSWLGKQYYDQRVWHKSGYGPSYPFSPDATDTITLTIFPDGTVRVYPNNGQVTHTFSATCSGGVMFGAPAATVILSPTPMYTITFEAGMNSAPPQ